MESTTSNFDHHQHQQQHQHHIEDSHDFVGCSPLNSTHPSSSDGYGVSTTSLDWNPISTIFSTTGTPSSNNFNNKLYTQGNEFLSMGESRPPGNTLNSPISTNAFDNGAKNLFNSYLQSNLPKMEEDMLNSFTSFSSLLQNPSSTSMENPANWFNNTGFPSSGTQYYNNRPTLSSMQLPLDHGFPNMSLLNQLGLVSSPNNSSSILSSTSSSTPRLGLNLQAMDFLGSNNNASFGGHNRVQHDALGEEVVSPLGKKSTATGALINGITGTKRAAGNHNNSVGDQPKTTSTSNTTKKSQLKVSCPPFKVRKEKLGDRIAALHQLVSPFGKTDTASVLTEAIGYITFLQDQIHTLCMPHPKPPRSKPCRVFQMGTVEDDGKEEERVELRRRGLCLVPLSWTSFLTPTQLDATHQSFY